MKRNPIAKTYWYKKGRHCRLANRRREVRMTELEALIDCARSIEQERNALVKALAAQQPLVNFGRAMLARILADQWFFHSEDSIAICEILQSLGYAEFVPYDPEVHGECEADVGDMIWVFTDAMRRDAGALE